MSFADYNTDPNANTFVGSVNIGEGCPPGNLNNAIRQVMADLRSAFSTALGSFFLAADLPTARVSIKALGSEGTEQLTGELLHNGAGATLYNATTGMASGRVFLTPASASDPTSLAGDWWITY